MSKDDICEFCKWRPGHYMCPTCHLLNSLQVVSLVVFFLWGVVAFLMVFVPIPTPDNMQDMFLFWAFGMLLPLTLGLFSAFNDESEGMPMAVWVIATFLSVGFIAIDWDMPGAIKALFCGSLIFIPPIFSYVVITLTYQPWKAPKPEPRELPVVERKRLMWDE